MTASTYYAMPVTKNDDITMNQGNDFPETNPFNIGLTCAVSSTPSTSRLCQHTILAVYRLNQLYVDVKEMFTKQNLLVMEPTPKHMDDDNCTVNATKFMYNLFTASTAVDMISNETDQQIPHIKQDFTSLIDFLQINIFTQSAVIDQPFLGHNININWLVSRVLSTLQNTKQILLSIGSGRCQIV
ncbi:uncharacterized protein [Argopecten irradians]|uniref:uncharacterized protein n=1 Tax=Argopecten irradians TaxID=31199 RepID=UPI00372164BE